MSEDLTKKLPKGDDNVAFILQNIDSRLQSLEQKVEERLHDTRPIWQKVVDDIAVLQEGQAQLQSDMRDVKISVREVVRSIGVVYETAIRIQAECRDLNHRILDIELEQQKQRNSST
jgi:chromosome segregation ATPase